MNFAIIELMGAIKLLRCVSSGVTVPTPLAVADGSDHTYAMFFRILPCKVSTEIMAERHLVVVVETTEGADELRCAIDNLNDLLQADQTRVGLIRCS